MPVIFLISCFSLFSLGVLLTLTTFLYITKPTADRGNWAVVQLAGDSSYLVIYRGALPIWKFLHNEYKLGHRIVQDPMTFKTREEAERAIASQIIKWGLK